jgi:hypothetical protein
MFIAHRSHCRRHRSMLRVALVADIEMAIHDRPPRFREFAVEV